MSSVRTAALAALAAAALGCNGAGRGASRPPVVRSDPALMAGLKSLEEPRGLRHTVVKGDTLFGLGRRYGVPVAAIVAANPGAVPTDLKVGTVLIVPGAGPSVPQMQSTAPQTGPKPAPARTPDRGRLRHPAGGTARAVGGGVPGAEFAVPAGSTAVAAGGGTVVMATQDLGGLGPTVMVDHGSGVVTMYARLADYAVKPGQKVGRGEPLGRVGATGLLFRVYEGPVAKPPGPYLGVK